MLRERTAEDKQLTDFTCTLLIETLQARIQKIFPRGVQLK